MLCFHVAQTGKHMLRTENVSEQNRKHFLCPQQKLRALANGETFVSATMCPQQCVLVYMFTASLPKQGHSRPKSCQLRRLIFPFLTQVLICLKYVN